MSKHSEVKIDLPNLLKSFQIILKRTIYKLSFGIDSANNHHNFDWPPNISFISFDPAQNIKIDYDYAKSDFLQWLTTNSFRDTIEIILLFLDEIRKVSVLFSYGSERRMLEAQWNKEIIKGGETFHRYGLTKKFEELKANFNLDIGQALIDHAISLYQARNCLVHRNGVVGEIDFNDGDKLTVSWTKMQLTYKNAEGLEIDIIEQITVEGGAEIYFSNQIKTKSFSLGERIVFSHDELTQIIYSNFLLAQSSITAVEKYAINNGNTFQPPQSP